MYIIFGYDIIVLIKRGLIINQGKGIKDKLCIEELEIMEAINKE